MPHANTSNTPERQMRDGRILDTMSIRDAWPFIPARKQALLVHWADTFEVALADFHAGHFATYQHERLPQTSAQATQDEVPALLDLLHEQGLGKNIPTSQGNSDPSLGEEEFAGLPEQVREYIRFLRRQASYLQSQITQQDNQIRRSNWGRSR
jgi:hypothetical protein